jgi:hypothetical protein
MIATQAGVGPESVRAGAEPIVWVEGEANDGAGPSIDVAVIDTLLRDTPPRVMGLGKSSGIQAAARALHAYHSHYYFVIDRDHFDDQTVEGTWRNFPDPDQNNLLIWRKRTIENYFLDAAFLDCSRYRKTGVDVEAALEQVAGQFVFMDIANAVILEIRERLKADWIRLFRTPAPFQSKDLAWDELKHRTEWAAKRKAANDLLAETTLSDLFDAAVDRFLGSAPQPRHGEGAWRDLMAGKPLYNHLVNQAFHVVDREGRVVRGREAQHAVAIDLIASGQCLPVDFVRFRQFIEDLSAERGTA